MINKIKIKIVKDVIRMKQKLMSILIVIIVSISITTPGHAMSFSDVPTTHSAKQEIEYLSTRGIINGTLNGEFLPNKEVTRAQAAAMIGRALQFNGEKRSTSFKDVSSNHFASGYIFEASKKGIISGYKNDTFQPNKSITRGEMALMLNRAFNLGASTIPDATSKLMSLGIAQGYPNGTFGSSFTLTRAHFAVFLAKTINSTLRIGGDRATFKKEGIVNVSILNMRSGPSTNDTVIKKLSEGQKVYIDNSVGEWLNISVDGITGFVVSKYLNGQGEAVVTPTNSLSKETIVIDAGHGYPDAGASGYGILEKDVTLDTSLRLAAYVKKSPFKVVLTREKDTKIELSDRVKIANDVEGDLFVSIHANSSNGEGHGTETYFTTTKNSNSAQSEAEATYIQNRLLATWKLTDRGVKDGNFHVIRENSMPAVLVELGFIDNKADNDKLRSPQMREAAAKAIYLGILDYYHHYEKMDVSALYKAIGESPSKKLH
jgi:N-acetylmuramoyl-L-alanine amidase